MWVGFLRRGTLGALAVATAFIMPSFLLVLTVAAIWRTALIGTSALILLLKWKIKEPYLVALGAAAGIILH